MRISLTADLWKEIKSAKMSLAKKNKVRKSSARMLHSEPTELQTELMPFSDEWISEPGTWFARFVKIERRRYLVLMQPCTFLTFHISGIRDKDLASPIQMFDHWIRQGLLACGLTEAVIDSWVQEQGEMVFCNGGSRSLIAKINQAVRESRFHEMDLARPVKRELALNSLYLCLYQGFHLFEGKSFQVLERFCQVFFPGQSLQITAKPGRPFRKTSVRFADSTPALPLPGVEVIVELCRFGAMFDYPIGSPAEERQLPIVRRVLHVPVDSNLFQLNQAIQASLGLLAYHHYRYYPAVGADAKRPISEIYCWDAPPDYPYGFDFGGDGDGVSDEIGHATGEVNQQKQKAVPQLSDLSIIIREIQAQTDFMFYEYDFGDGWVYTIKLGEAVELPGFVCRLADGEGDPPPVDVGGLPGWHEFLKALAKPRSNAAAEMLAWAKVVLWSPFDLTMMQERLERLDYLDGEYWAEAEDPDAE